MAKRLVTIVLVFGLALAASAKNVPAETARAVAARWLGLDVATLQPQPSPYGTIHVFAIDGGGFVLVSADDCVQPVLGYSLSGEWKMESGKLPSNVMCWLEGYDRQIRAAREAGNRAVHRDWTATPKSVYDTTIGPLMTTAWGQYPYYNALCPDSAGSGVMTLSGCVATAMGQVMKYWNWPDSGVGSHSYTDPNYGPQSATFEGTAYDWTHMPVRLTAASSDEEVAAVATLLRHCGVAAEMQYGTYAEGGSAAGDICANGDINFHSAEMAMRTYFKYSPMTRGVLRENFSDSEWKALMKNEIDHRRPVFYCGGGPTGGHAFVCDGYDTNGFFHFNWGWDGLYEAFFSLGNLNPGYSIFNDRQTAIVGIEPDTLYGSGASCRVTTIADPQCGSVSGGGTYTWRDTVILTALPAAGHVFHHWSDGNKNNPYRLLAHNVTLEAVFADVQTNSGDTLSHFAAEGYANGMNLIDSTYRFGTRFPPEMLRGRGSLLQIDVFATSAANIVRIYHGNDNAPGRLIHELTFIPENPVAGWRSIVFDEPLPIAQDSSLWIVTQSIGSRFGIGAKQTSIPDANWISLDDGVTWQHLTELDADDNIHDNTLSWYVRCITTMDTTTAGISELSNEGLRIYPNPTHGRVTIEGMEAGTTVTVMDLNGREIQTVRQPITLALPSGTYIVRAVSEGAVTTRKLIVR